MYDIQKTVQAGSLAEALTQLNENPGARPVAGGTDLMVQLRHHKLKEAVLVNIREIPKLSEIRLLENGDLLIGSCASFDDIYRNELARSCVPMLCEACNQVGSPQIRHIGTIGGNLCNGAVSADSAPSVLAYDAYLQVESLSGSRIIPASEWHTGPGRTVLGPDELLTGIIIPKKIYEGSGGCYLKFGQRNAMEIATLGVAALVRLTEDRKHIDIMHMAFGVASNRPVRVRRLEDRVSGMEIGEELYRTVEETVTEELDPRDSFRASKEFRIRLIRVQSVRALKEAAMQAGGMTDV